MKITRLLIIFGLIIGLVAACTPVKPANPDEVPSSMDQQEPEEPLPVMDSKWEKIDEMINNMTLEERVGQVFMVAFRKNQQNKPILRVDQTTSNTLKTYPVGGVILFTENIDTVDQTISLIQELQGVSRIPLFIGIDEEGGAVSRLHKSGKIPATKLPGNDAIGKANDPQLAYDVGKILGRELSALGFTMNFAPVADVNSNPKNPVIGRRSFGQEPHQVAEMVAKMVEGMQEENVSAVVKHFPGHGDTAQDTHHEAVKVEHDLERLRQLELIPFKAGIEAGVDGVMTAHIQVPQVTGSNLPSTLSSEIMGLLRQELGHKKLIITDALEMKAISDHYTSGEAVVLAFEAGADILLMPESLEEGYEALLKAVQEGRIPEDRLLDSVRRILSVKYDRGLWEEKPPQNPLEVLGNEAHRKTVEEIKKKGR